MTTSIKVLALMGSPRKGGNSDILLNSAIAGAQDSGALVERVWLRQLKVSPCIECGSCNKTGQCILKDDMTDLYPKIEEADRLILAAPVFFYGVSAFAKSVVDRFQPFWARKYLLKQDMDSKNKWAALIAVGATKGKRLFEGSVMMAKYCFSDSGFRYFGHALVGGIEHPADLEEHPDYAAELYKLGSSLVTNPEHGYSFVPFAEQEPMVKRG